MLDNSQVVALRGLVLGYQEAEPERWPAAAEREVTLLRDVVLLLGGDERQAAEVLGLDAYSYVQSVTDAPI